jgi:hypothetical protein
MRSLYIRDESLKKPKPMAVTTKGKSRSKSRAGTIKRKRAVKPRNVPAKALADQRYRPRVVRSAKAYSRKGKIQAAEGRRLIDA